MSETTPKKAPRKGAGRSKITNGSLGDMDGRSRWARRLADLIEGYTQDVTDDPSSLSTAKKVMIRQAATLTLALERNGEAFAKDDNADGKALGEYQTTASALRRILGDLQVSMSSTERLRRAPDPSWVENGRLMRRTHEGFTSDDWRLSHGDDIPADADRATARAIAFAIAVSVKDGIPMSDSMAQVAVDVGLAEYADAQEENVVDLSQYRH